MPRFMKPCSKVTISKLKEKSVFFSLHSFIFLVLLSFPYVFSVYMAWRLSLGIVKSKWNMGVLAQNIDTVFKNPDIYFLHLKLRYLHSLK